MIPDRPAPGRLSHPLTHERKNQMSTKKTPSRFGSMDPERQRQIASEGGRTAHREGRAHKFTSEEAREAGRKGGRSKKAKRSAA